MVGFILRNTLFEFGSVARGACRVAGDSYLESVTELAGIEKNGAAAKYTDGAGIVHQLSGDETVSMNMWGFIPTLFGYLQKMFSEFFEKCRGRKGRVLPSGGCKRLGPHWPGKMQSAPARWIRGLASPIVPTVHASLKAFILWSHTATILATSGYGPAARHSRDSAEIPNLRQIRCCRALRQRPYQRHLCANFDQGGTPVRYILQRINHNVFKNPVPLMENIQRVTAHLGGKMSGERDSSRRTLTLILSRDGRPYHCDEHGNYWRAYIFIEKAHTYDAVESPHQAFEAAKGIWAFSKPAGRPARTQASRHDSRFSPARRNVLPPWKR